MKLSSYPDPMRNHDRKVTHWEAPRDAALRRARRTLTVQLGRDDLLLAALTNNGTRTEGTIGDLASLAGWLDAVNHDGSDAATIARDLTRLARAGRITYDGDRFSDQTAPVLVEVRAANMVVWWGSSYHNAAGNGQIVDPAAEQARHRLKALEEEKKKKDPEA